MLLFKQCKAVSFPQLEELISPQCRPKPRINEEKKQLKSCISWRFSSYDLQSRYKFKIMIKRHRVSPETVGALGEMLGDGVDNESAQPRVG